MQSIIYRRIKYILYIADKQWWVLHMYSMYVNFYVQSFLHIQKALFLFFFVYIYIQRDFSYTPHQHLYYNNEKEKHLHICQSIFYFLYYKCIFIKIYLCTKKLFFIRQHILFSESHFPSRVAQSPLPSACVRPVVTLLVSSKTSTLNVFPLWFCCGVQGPC